MGFGRLPHHAENHWTGIEPRNGQDPQLARVENGDSPPWEGGSMRLAPFACSACGSRYWPDPDSSCELCQPSTDDHEHRRRYAEPDWEAEDDTRRLWEEEQMQQTENENQ